jgi:hypothetical protein
MRHSQKHRGRTIVVHARPREHHHGYAWTYSVEELPAIAGRGITGDDTDAQTTALSHAMCAARQAIDESGEVRVPLGGKARGDAVIQLRGLSAPAPSLSCLDGLAGSAAG